MTSDILQRLWLQRVLLLIIAIVAYWNAFNGAFQFDDFAVIVDNPAVHSLASWLDSMPGIRPLLKLSYSISWASGSTELSFHLFNLICHLANCLLVFAILKRWPAANADLAAFVATAIFALHPMSTEAVTYISGRSVSLMAFFYLSAFLAYIKSSEALEGQHSSLRTVVAPILFLAALATKETAWTLPFALILWEYTRNPQVWRQSLSKLLPLWVVMLAGLAMIFGLETYRHLFEFSLQSRPPLANLLTQFSGQIYLLKQLFWPFHPNIDPDLQIISHITPTVALQIISIFAVLIWGVIQLKICPWLGLAILWFFLQLIPTNSIVPRLDVANDRQLYLACIGPIFAITYAFGQLIPNIKLRRVIVIVTLLVLGSITVNRNSDYQNEITLWQATVAQSPKKARAWLNLGYAYKLAGMHEEAIRAYQQALVLKPDYEQARINLKLLIHKE